ncbi:dual OB domain-containing protein [Rahnella variigena]|uniref:dual OB domain-containing protein n=1 Tax=Rahnella variigena TaxID=574964 RepID=UPI003D292A57
MRTVHQLVCLAKSWKNGGFCIAGKNANNQWIRTITSNQSNNSIFQHGEGLNPLDTFSATTLRHSPHGHQTENYVIDENVIFTVSGSLNVNNLSSYIDETDSLWGTGVSSRYGINDKVIIGQGIINNSLYFIKPDDTVFVQMQDEYGTNKIRVRFTYNRVEYLLTTTDIGLQEYFRKEENRLNVGEEEELPDVKYLTISLAEPLNDNLYKVIAGIF